MDKSSIKGGLILGLLILLSLGLAAGFHTMKLGSSRVETIQGDKGELEKMNLISTEMDLEDLNIRHDMDKKDIEGIKSNIKNIAAYILKDGRPEKITLKFDKNDNIKAIDKKSNRYSILNELTYDHTAYVVDPKNSHGIYLNYSIEGVGKKIRLNEKDLIGYTGNDRIEVKRLEKYKDKTYLVLSYSVKNTDKATMKNNDLIEKLVFAEIVGDGIQVLNRLDILSDSENADSMKIIAAFDKMLIFSYRDNPSKGLKNEMISLDLASKKLTREDISSKEDSKGIYINPDIYDSYIKYDKNNGILYLISRENYQKPFHIRSYKMKEDKLVDVDDRTINLDDYLTQIQLPIKDDKMSQMGSINRVNIMMKGKKVLIIKDNNFNINQWKGKGVEKTIKNEDGTEIPEDRDNLEFNNSSIYSSTQIYIYDVDKDKITYSGAIKGQLEIDARTIYMSEKEK